MTRLILIALLIVQSFSAAAQTSAPEGDWPIAQRLKLLAQRMDSRRDDLHVPGCALVIVKDGQVVFNQGFGWRDVEAELAVTTDTLFAVGSTTKGFTATLVGMLVDDGRVKWDDLVRTHLPEFQLKDPDANQQATIRDLLCHHIGLNRTDLAWAGGEASRAEVLQAAFRAQPTAGFREKWQYQNIMFLAAGEAAARAAGSDFDTLLRERIFEPLAMRRSNSTISACLNDPLLSKGYQWDEQTSSFERLPMRRLDNIAPAGAINSTSTDMAQWLRLLLGRGTLDGVRLISEEALNETWTKQSTMMPGTDYGLGWFLRDWRGRRLIEHGGNIDGFSAQVALLPDEHIGFALLTNVSATPLQGLAIDIVFDALLGDQGATEEPLNLAEVEKYLGKYRFDALKSDVTVLTRNGKLAIDVPGQMIFDLKPPDADGKWAFDFPAPIQVRFVADSSGQVTHMNLYQAGMEFELPREGFQRPPEISLQDAAPYLGTYHSDDMGADLTVLLKDGRLAVNVPGQMAYELHQPDAQGLWRFRVKNTLYVSFTRDQAGEVTAMTMVQDGKTFNLPRTAREDPEDLPTLDEVRQRVHAALGAPAASDIRTIRITSAIDMINQGITGTRTVLAGSKDQIRQDLDLGIFGNASVVVDGDVGQAVSSFMPTQELTEVMREQIKLQHPLALHGSWTDMASNIVLQGIERHDDRKVFIISLAGGRDRESTIAIDAQTWLPMKQTVPTTLEGLGTFTTTITFADWRGVDGVQIPFHVTISNDIHGTMSVMTSDVAVNADLGADAFKAPGNS